MKRRKMVGVMILIIIMSFFIIINKSITKPLKIEDDIVINVENGESFYSILHKLNQEDKISGLPIIKLYIKLTGKEIEIKPGEYTLHKDMSVNDLINSFNTESSRNIVKFTVPEGYTIDDIAEKLEKEGICKAEEFISSVKDYPLPNYVKQNASKRYNLEGYLFPDTYVFNANEDPNVIIEKMISRFEEIWKIALEKSNMKVKNEDIETVITIASMIEKEARIDKERPIVSSVIINRLNEKMMLQIDATVIYALGDHIDKVLYSHLEIDSPYNTYKNHGLPIGPISNPGLPSILAALTPEETDYLFYVLQDDNTHYFTNNFEEFLDKQEELGY